SLALPGLLIHLSRIAKARKRDTFLEGFPWRGEERVLDVCCGSGLLLIAAAKRLTNGTATGIDLWDADPFSGNKAQGVWFNTAAEGVPAHRIRLVTGDARQLPFADATFEVVICRRMPQTLGRDDREQALREMARVLAPGGHLGLLDTSVHRSAYTKVLQAYGLADVRVRSQRSLIGCTLMARRPMTIPMHPARACTTCD